MNRLQRRKAAHSPLSPREYSVDFVLSVNIGTSEKLNMHSAYVSRQTDSPRQIVGLNFYALEISSTKPLLWWCYLAHARGSNAAGIPASKRFQVRMEGEGSDTTEKFLAVRLPSPAAAPVLSAGRRAGWASGAWAPGPPASSFIRAARNGPSLAPLHLNTPVLPNTWLDLPLSK